MLVDKLCREVISECVRAENKFGKQTDINIHRGSLSFIKNPHPCKTMTGSPLPLWLALEQERKEDG